MTDKTQHTAELAHYASEFKNQIVHFYVGEMVVYADNRKLASSDCICDEQGPDGGLACYCTAHSVNL